MIRRPPRSTPLYSSAASDVYKRQGYAVRDIFRRYQPESMLFIGDDTTDIDGINQLIKLRDAGVVKGLTVAVKSKPTNKHLLKKADAYVENVEGVGKLLDWALKNYS